MSVFEDAAGSCGRIATADETVLIVVGFCAGFGEPMAVLVYIDACACRKTVVGAHWAVWLRAFRRCRASLDSFDPGLRTPGRGAGAGAAAAVVVVSRALGAGEAPGEGDRMILKFVAAACVAVVVVVGFV